MPSPVPEAAPLLSLPIEAMRQPVQEGATRPLSWRLEQLGRVDALLTEVEADLLEALAQDQGKPPLEANFEQVGVREELKFTRRHLKRWMGGHRVQLPGWSWPARARVRPEPLGCVLILGPWNYPSSSASSP